jgi:hypothetical protein
MSLIQLRCLKIKKLSSHVLEINHFLKGKKKRLNYQKKFSQFLSHNINTKTFN